MARKQVEADAILQRAVEVIGNIMWEGGERYEDHAIYHLLLAHDALTKVATAGLTEWYSQFEKSHSDA